MATGKDLKRRISSVKSTQQITKAIKMVAAARLRRAQEAIVRARPFASAIDQVVQNLTQNEQVRETHPLLAKRAVKKVNVVLLTSERGLCGGFNTNLTKRAEALYRNENGKYEKLVFTCIGKKGYEYLSLRKIPVARYFPEFQKGLTFARVEAFASELVEDYLKGEYDEIRVIFSEFRSAISQVPRTDVLLPVSLEQNAKAEGPRSDFLYEPSQEAILAALLPRYFTAKLYRSLLENIASEYGAQMSAMESATKNAGEMIKKLTLEYNKVRQAGITKELLEIVSGAEALK